MRIMGAGGEQTGRFYNEEWSIYVAVVEVLLYTQPCKLEITF